MLTRAFAATLILSCSGSIACAGSVITTLTPVRVDGVGPIKVGMTKAEAERAVGAALVLERADA